MRTRGKTGNLPEARENASDQVGIWFISPRFDWLRKWREFSTLNRKVAMKKIDLF